MDKSEYRYQGYLDNLRKTGNPVIYLNAMSYEQWVAVNSHGELRVKGLTC